MKRRTPSSLTILLLIGLLSCSGSGSITITPPPAGSGQIKLVLTDFPVSGRDVSQVNVQIMTIDVQQSGWNTVINFGQNGRIFDLLKLQNGNTVDLGAFNLPAGNYNQMRMVLGTQNTVLVNEGAGYVVKPLQTPSGQSAGVKLTGGFTISNQGYTTLLLDFDASQSVKYAGNKYQLNPTIRVVSADTSQAFFSLTPFAIAGQTLIPPLATGVTVDPTIAPNGLMALKSISIGNSVTLNSNVYVLGSCDASAMNSCLIANKELQTGVSTIQSSTYVTRANRVNLGNSTQILGTLGFNSLTQGTGVTIGSQVTPPGAVPSIPDFLVGQLGLVNLTIANSPLVSGLYYTLNVASGQTMQLTGGNYHFDSVILGNNSTLRCNDSCILMVKTAVSTGTGVTITATNNDPNYIYIFVAGKNGATLNPNVTGNVADTPKAVSLGSTNIIRANFHVPYGSVTFGASNQYSGFALAHEITVGDSSTITGTTAQVAFSGQYIAQATYQGEALQYDFTGNSNSIRMLSSSQPQYIFHGSYSYNIITKQAFVTYDTVDLIDPDCIPCQSTGTYPPIATYTADQFFIQPAATGFELVSYTNTQIQARVLFDNAIVTFARRSGFGPFDE